MHVGKGGWKKRGLDWLLENTSSLRVDIYWNRLLRELVESPSVEVFKTCVVLGVIVE